MPVKLHKGIHLEGLNATRNSYTKETNQQDIVGPDQTIMHTCQQQAGNGHHEYHKIAIHIPLLGMMVVHADVQGSDI